MTQSIPSEHTSIQNSSLVDIAQKNFSDLSTAEMEQLMKGGIKQTKKRMHDKGISTVISVDENIYEEHPDGSLTLLHERSTK